MKICTCPEDKKNKASWVGAKNGKMWRLFYNEAFILFEINAGALYLNVIFEKPGFWRKK